MTELQAYPMNGGDGHHSYTKNSNYQKNVMVSAKELITENILEKLDIKSFNPPISTFRIADLGCSVGPNTFLAVQNIMEAVKFKYQKLEIESEIPEFQVFFNDHVANDFNTLFTSMASNREYYAAGVPGSFYNRLFPASSLHVVYSVFSIQWLSKVPKHVVDKSSSAWSKGRVHYSSAPDAVIKVFEAQFRSDMDSFLSARAKEVVQGGLMTLLAPGRPNGTAHSLSPLNLVFDGLGPCIMELVNKGVVEEEKLESFNIPIYHMSAEELAEAVERNGCFSIEQIEAMPNIAVNFNLPKEKICLHVRAIVGVLVKQHFGEEILDQLFELYLNKLEEHAFKFNPQMEKAVNIFAFLKRK
ncbi:S-adenosylmethionine-dependent methyltransferase [Quillaja saponaria]|uniref:S-adenosylmethionine-dependent methyltransferase n=1 Tax=Quillaja saponaria TaxID=32244 RepID=A0AAD7VFM9_QUISA|nr:S-adenosylmethionine-dependent methyltransferase [Quillaja saponaria]